MEPSALQIIAFVVLIPVFLAMYACAVKFIRLLVERYPDRLEELGLEDLRDWSGDLRKGFTVPESLMRFVRQRRYLRLRDSELFRLAETTRWLYFTYVAGFVVLFASILYDGLAARFGPRGRDEAAAEAAPAAAPAAAVSRYEALRTQAYELHRKGRLNEAVAIYDELQRFGTVEAEVVLYSGNARAQLGHYDAALVDFRRVMDLEPGNFKAHLHADRILSRQRRWDDCIDVWNRYLRVVPGDAEAHYERSGTYFHMGDHAASQADLRRACELGKAAACGRAEIFEKKAQ